MDDKKDFDQGHNDSDTGSEGSAEPEGAQHPNKTYEIFKKKLSRHYSAASNGGGRFYVDVSIYTPNKPDLTMHVGDGSSGAIVAVSHLVKLSSRIKVGRGDPKAAPNDLLWEEMARENHRGSIYAWSMELNGAHRNFLWKRTRSVGIDGKSPSTFGFRNWKLVDKESNAVLAVFSATRSMGKCGDLQLRVDYGEEFERMVLITYISLLEKARRRRASSAANSGGGGGA